MNAPTGDLPRDIGGYRLLSEMGRGGMGVVYRGVDLKLARPVAVKMLLPPKNHDASVAQRFMREARAAARIDSKHVVKVLSIGEAKDGGEPYIVMELLDGRTLEDEIKRAGPLDVARAVRVAVQMAEALAAAHAIGVIHRDVKAANAMLVEKDGRELVKVLDFGVAKIADGDASTLTTTGIVVGTASWMAPEQLDGGDVTAATDVYALGCLLYRMLTGEPVFTGSDWRSLAYQHCQKKPAPPSKKRRQVSRPLDAIVLRCLAKKPADRFVSMRALTAALAASVAAAPRRTSKAGIAAGVSLGLFAAGACAFGLWSLTHTTHAATAPTPTASITTPTPTPTPLAPPTTTTTTPTTTTTTTTATAANDVAVEEPDPEPAATSVARTKTRKSTKHPTEEPTTDEPPLRRVLGDDDAPLQRVFPDHK